MLFGRAFKILVAKPTEVHAFWSLERTASICGNIDTLKSWYVDTKVSIATWFVHNSTEIKLAFDSIDDQIGLGQKSDIK